MIIFKNIFLKISIIIIGLFLTLSLSVRIFKKKLIFCYYYYQVAHFLLDHVKGNIMVVIANQYYTNLCVL